MTAHETQLAGDLLDQLADRFADEQRNDWQFPSTWDSQQRIQFLNDVNDWNGSPPDTHPHNHAVAGFLAHRLKTQ